ncbi:hypothetical protein G6F16_001758 [Rhizopus arrhizus]|nr:hypothetical protein G6F23_003278 [Rhizopus arrhizus]KAG0768992.1 hypothetical protein G6F24_001449 [Rhizopus arrhizus]KAG0796630.1 hypothetical protein G6F21_001168 [Rhizopus arrhizus]KAG0802327.1 hypothetical protein G6F22_000372 [Rhizopus arrhizus]KAG0818415.1 hypothetical protein G6F20_001578 [Rhizopus arrhizus]
MKSKKSRNTSNNPSGDDLSPRNNAFNFIKNRFFQSNSTNGFQRPVEDNRKNTQSLTHTPYSQPLTITNAKPQQADKPLSRSFDEQSTLEFSNQNYKNQRPMSMDVETLLQQSDFPNNSTALNRRSKRGQEKRTSFIIIKEGYLFKKTDFRPFHKQTKLDRGWKLYKVVLRGHKLYLFKALAESPLRSFFPSSPSLSVSSSSNHSTTSLKLVSSEFEREAQHTFFHNPASLPQGLIFMELNQSNMQPKRQVQLVLDNSCLYICYRSDKKQLWKIEQKISIPQLKINQINPSVDSIDSPTSPTSTNSQQSDPFLYKHSNALVFSLSFINKPTLLGLYSTQFLHAGQAWIQTFQTICQKKALFVEEDLLYSRSNDSFDYHGSSTATTILDFEPGNDSRMCDATQRYHPDLLRKCWSDTDNDVIGGTISALVHELLLTDNEEYVNTFLLNYSTFTTGSNVLNEIKAFSLAFSSILDGRILNLFTVWCERFALDVMGDVASGMISVLESIITVDTTKVKQLVLDTVAENAKLTACDEIKYQENVHDPDNQEEEVETTEIENILAEDGGSVNLSNLLITGLMPTTFLLISSDRFAEQVYLFHLLQHTKYKHELMSSLSYLPRPQTSVEMLNSLLFTTASPHFLTKLIRNHILIDSQQQGSDGVLLRAQLLKHWIRVGTKLHQLGDTTGWCAVAMGLCSVGIVRLKEAWKSVERDMVYTVQTHWARTLAEHGLFEQIIWTETWEHETHFKFAQVLHLDSPFCLPFFGTIRQAVDRRRKHPKKSLGPNMINFEECERIYKTIKLSLDTWRQASIEGEYVDIKAVGPLQSFFEHSVTDLISVPHDLKYLQEFSLACEPKVFGQAYDRSTNQIVSESTTNTNFPLHFPAILENCTVWDSDWSFIYSSKRMAGENIVSIPPPFLNENSIQDGAETVQQDHHPGENNLQSTSPTDRKGLRRRTFSFPPGGMYHTTIGESCNSKYELLESINSKTWFGSLASGRQHNTYSSKALMEAHRKSRAIQSSNGEFDLVVAQGELIFKASAILRNKDKDIIHLKRTGSLHSVQFLKQAQEDEKKKHSSRSELLVTVKGAYFDHLVDCLIYGISPHHDVLKEQWQMISFTEGFQYQTDKVIMDEESFISVFFMTYRSYKSPVYLLNKLQNNFLNVKSKFRLTAKKKASLILLETYFSANTAESSTNKAADVEDTEINSYDWKDIATAQLRILNLVLYWLEEHPYDFTDEPNLIRYINIFSRDAKENLANWHEPLKRYLLKSNVNDTSELSAKLKEWTNAVHIGDKIEKKIAKLEDQVIRNSLSPCYDMKSIRFDIECFRNIQDLYHQLMHGSQRYTTTLQLATNKRIPLSISHKPVEQDVGSLVDRYPPEVLLEQVDTNVRQLFECASIQDWAQTFDVLEAQCTDLYAWLPSRKPNRTSKIFTSFSAVVDAPSPNISDYRVLAEEIIISDIFTTIQGAKRSVVSPSAFSDDDFLSAFPSSIQHLYCLHFIIRSWAIHEMASPKIDSKARTMRIEKFLQIVLLSKMCSEKMTLFPELKTNEAKKKRIPGFVENAIASALVSPEVRLFTKAWNDIALQYGHASLDSLESLLNKIQKAYSLTTRSSTSLLSLQDESPSIVTPSLGWIFERVMEICFTIPDTIEKKDGLISFDKRRYLYHFLQLIVNVQVDIHEHQQRQAENKGLSMSFLISPNPSKLNWKDLKEHALRESKKSLSQGASGGKGLRGPSSRSHGSKAAVFNKLITKQMDKLKKDFKERDRVDKDWLTLQHKLQKKQVEQAKFFEKQERPYSMMPRLNSFFKGLRPPSLVSSPIHHIFPTNNSHDHFAATKASTVINLIHSTTSIASTYTKRDFVFRIVTEEGGQYLFQGMNCEDMHDWMRQINDAAREGAAKRQSVLAAESLDNESERRQSAILIETSARNASPSHRKSIYSVSLDILMRDGQIPLIVEKCIQEIEKRGLEEVGIYRVAGTGSVVSALKAEFNKDVNKVNLGDSKWADINVIADAFKQFLRELPEPLLTYTYYDEFINASASEDHDQRVYLIKEVLKKLPYTNYTLLKRIIEHFVNVTDFEAINHMYATNLAIVFGPTLLQPAPGPASFVTTMSNLGHHQNIVKYLILNYHYLFDVESEDVEAKEEQALTVE